MGPADGADFTTGPDGGSGAPLHWIEELDWKAYAITAFRLHEIDHLNQGKKVLQAVRAPSPHP